MKKKKKRRKKSNGRVARTKRTAKHNGELLHAGLGGRVVVVEERYTAFVFVASCAVIIKVLLKGGDRRIYSEQRHSVTRRYTFWYLLQSTFSYYITSLGVGVGGCVAGWEQMNERENEREKGESLQRWTE